MTVLFIVVAIVVGGGLGLLLWSARHRASPIGENIGRFDEQTLACSHTIHFQHVRQIFESTDLRYLNARVDRSISRHVLKERHNVALKFLRGLYQDFLKLEEASSIVATLSANVDARQEWHRFRLGAEFRLKYWALRAKYAAGLATTNSFRDLAWMVSSLAVELEQTVSEIAAGAALAQQQRPSSQA